MYLTEFSVLHVNCILWNLFKMPILLGPVMISQKLSLHGLISWDDDVMMFPQVVCYGSFMENHP